MKSARLLRHLAIVVAALLIFGAAGTPSLSAADATMNISDRSVSIFTAGSYDITCSSPTGNTITVGPNITVTITLKSVSITSSSSALYLQPGASVTLLLDGNSTLTSTGRAGIYVPVGASLIINEASPGGTLTVNGGSDSAGIGGDSPGSGGTVTILGGTVTANGGLTAAGIGGGNYGSGGTFNIYGGTVNATGGSGGAGIGGGIAGNGGTVNIYGGTVNATSVASGAGIGGGVSGGGGAINIFGGIVHAQGGQLGAGIGSGSNASGTTAVTISGGTVTATGGEDSAGIGGGNGSNCGKVTITGGTVTATGNGCGAGIGGGFANAGGEVLISGLNTRVTAQGGTSGFDIGAGGPSDKKDVIDGGTLSVQDGAHLTLITGIKSSNNPIKITLGNCTVDGTGAGEYAGTHFAPKPQIPSGRNEQTTSETKAFLRSTSGSGVEIDVSALALPAGVTLISNDFSGLPTQAAGKTWTLSHKLAGTNGTFHGKDYLALYDFTLTDENGKPVTGYLGRVTVRLPIPSGSKDNLHVLYYDESGKQFTEVMAVPDNGYLTYSTTHFSSYLITGNGATAEKPAIPETGAPSFPFAAAGAVLVLTLLTVYIVRNKIKD